MDALACLASSVLTNLCSYCDPMAKQGILAASIHDITQRRDMSPCMCELGLLLSSVGLTLKAMA